MTEGGGRMRELRGGGGEEEGTEGRKGEGRSYKRCT